MNQTSAIKELKKWANRGLFLFRKHELAKLFPNDSQKTFEEGLSRLLKAGILKHVCRGVYLNEDALPNDGYLLEHIAKTLRAGEYNYVSLESMLSEYGAISQIPINHLTVMTTGRTAMYETPYGVVEFTHTKRSVLDILENTLKVENRPLRIATKQAAWRDLKRVGRNMHLVIDEDLL